MDIDIQYILDNFIEWFILEEAKEQASIELREPKKRHLFTQKLKHHWDSVIDKRFIHSLESAHNTPDAIKKELHSRGRDLCYVIAQDPLIDNKVMEVSYAVDKVFGRGEGAILVNLQVDKLFLETDGPRFLGKKGDLR
ncbi:MAG TPA: hypothetical protein VNB90_14760 [Cytophagaceae bacterium]|jgi:hypothetical protein|nr:hypothetical protein [Cytophagaceae bacterium]